MNLSNILKQPGGRVPVVINQQTKIDMKSLELQLKKRLLVVQGLPEDKISEKKYFNDGEMFISIKFICKGSNLTEETAAGLVEKKLVFSTPEIYFFEDYKTRLRSCMKAMDSFISAIEAQGWYWGHNPFDHVDPENSIYESDLVLFDKDLKRWQEAESRTFHPERTIIFEIVE